MSDCMRHLSGQPGARINNTRGLQNVEFNKGIKKKQVIFWLSKETGSPREKGAIWSPEAQATTNDMKKDTHKGVIMLKIYFNK